MRIGFFTDGYLPQLNGVATSTEELAKSLRKIGKQVVVVAPKYPNFKDEDKDVLRLKSLSIYKSANLRISYMFPDKILRQVIKEKFDIIHGFSGGTTPVLGLFLAKRKKVPYVFTYNTRWTQYTHYVLGGKVIKPGHAARIIKSYCNACTHIISPTQDVKDELVVFGVKKPITVIPSGVETNIFKPGNKDYLKEFLGLPKDSKVILYVGRLAKEKSIDFIVRSFAKLKSSKNSYLVLVGEGPEKGNLEKLINQLNLKDKVLLFGSLEHNDLPKIYNGADIFAFASTTETQGMVILEAMACALPLVTVKDKVYEQFVKNGEDGFLVEKDEDIFAEKVEQLLKDDNLRLKIAKKAQEKAEKFSLEETAKKFDTLYKSL